nr:MAG TPA: hypothetical protein [Caudoviricetes sp.]
MSSFSPFHRIQSQYDQLQNGHPVIKALLVSNICSTSLHLDFSSLSFYNFVKILHYKRGIPLCHFS